VGELATRDFRLRVALLMAVVSLASAYATHVATERAGSVANLNALASQQSAEEEQVEQQIDAIIAQDLRLTAKIDERWHTYLVSIAEANVAPGADPSAAAELDLRAQTNADHAFQLMPFFRAARPMLAAEASDDGEAAAYDPALARSFLRITDWRTFRASSELTRSEARAAGAVAETTVLIVVLFVGGLFLLTLAHLVGGHPRGLAIAVVGVLLVAGACLWLAILDPPAVIPLLVCAIVLVGLLVLVRVPRIRDWLAGIEAGDAIGDLATVPSRPGTTATVDPADAPAASFPRFVAVAIAAATLLGAAVGYLQSDASSAAEDHAWQARDLGVEAIGALRAAEEDLAVQVETYQQALGYHVDAWSATQQAELATLNGDADSAQRMQQETKRFEELAARSEARSGLVGELGSTGASSETALRQLRARVWEQTARLAGLQDGANAASRGWGARGGDYLAVLAWLAVAAYLLGLSLVFREQRVRTVLASVGIVLIAAGLTRTVLTFTQPEPITGTAAEAAAEAYAHGFVAQVRGDPVLAQSLYADAIALRPDFGIARRDRAQSFLESGSAPGLGFRAAFTDEAVNAAIAELEAASANGADTAGVALNTGAMLFHRAIATGAMRDMEASEVRTRMGLELGIEYENEGGPPHLNQVIGEANLGLVLLAQGDVPGAEAAYRRMASGANALAPGFRPSVIAGALAPLERLGEAPYAPSAEAITDMKNAILTETYGLEGRSPAHLDSAQAEVFASILQWRAQITDFDPRRDHLFVQWYRLDPDIERWSALPLLSGPVRLNAVVADFGGQFHPDAAAGRYWGNTNRVLADVPPSCIRPGRYRVELYLNGQLEASAEADSLGDAFQPVLARHLSVAMCAPANWTVTTEPGQSMTVFAPDASRGVAVFRVHQPRTTDADARNAAIDRVLAARTGALPPGLQPGVPIDAATEPPIFGRTDGVWRLHLADAGLAKVSATFLGTGTVLVVVVHGPEAWVASPEASAILQSLITPYD